MVAAKLDEFTTAFDRLCTLQNMLVLGRALSAAAAAHALVRSSMLRARCTRWWRCRCRGRKPRAPTRYGDDHI